MKPLIENWKKFINEAPDYKSKIKKLLDAREFEQVFDLTSTLGTSTQELPWSYENVDAYLDYYSNKHYPYGGGETDEAMEKAYADTSWTREEFKAEMKRREDMISQYSSTGIVPQEWKDRFPDTWEKKFLKTWKRFNWGTK